MGRSTCTGVWLVVLGSAACGQVVTEGPDAGEPDEPDAGGGSYTIGGMVSNLAGTGLVLRNNGGDDLTLDADGAFTFATELATGAEFAVTVFRQPVGGVELCTVSGGTGTVGTADVSSVSVDCANVVFTIGGTVTGIVGSTTLSNILPGGGTDNVTVSADGTYAFPTPVPTGSAFNVAIMAQPASAYCYVTGPVANPGQGTVGGANVGNVDLGCVETPTLSTIGDACDSSTSAIQWTEVPGATYTVEYGPSGNLASVSLAAGTTSYVPSPALGPGDYVARVRAHRGGLDGAFTETQPFHVGAIPTIVVGNNGPTCVGGGVTLNTTPAGATYAWTGPGGFTSTAQSPALTGLGSGGNSTGTYSVTVTVNGCSNTGSTTVATSSVAGSFNQTTTAQFNTNVNSSVVTATDQVALADDLDIGAGIGSTTYLGTSTMPGGNRDYANLTINAGVTVTVTGTVALVIRTTGTVTIHGTLEASGIIGGNGVLDSTFGTGGAGGPGGGAGGNGTYAAASSPAVPLAASTGGGFGPGIGGTQWSGGGGAGYAVVGSSAANGAGGQAYGVPAIATVTGGSGGGGGSGGNRCGGGGGGGGGGYVKISATTINVSNTGTIRVNGGNGGTDQNNGCGAGGGGSGGSIHLRARTLTVAGTLSAAGGIGGDGSLDGAAGAIGRIRLDGTSRTLTGTITPAAGLIGGIHLSPGSSRTVSIAPANMCTWGTLSYTSATPSGATLSVNVLNGNTNAVILSNVANGTNISGSVGASTPIKLEAQLSSTGSTATLSDWTVGYTTR